MTTSDKQQDYVQDLHGKLFDMPQALSDRSVLIHASALIVGRHGILLRGPTGSGKSVLQRYLRRRAKQKGQFAALISDDYVRLAAPAPDRFVAFAPVATRNQQEVHGLGIVSAGDEGTALTALNMASIHLLVDLVADEDVVRSPVSEQQKFEGLDGSLPRLCAPKGSSLVAADMIFAALSTF